MRKTRIRDAFGADSPALRGLSIGTVLVSFFLLFSVWLTLYHAYEAEREKDYETAYKETANIARAFEEHTLRTLKAADRATLVLKHHYEREGRTMDIPRYIQEGVLPGEQFLLLGVIDEYGDLAVSSQVPLVSVNLADREYFQVHRAKDDGQLHIGKPVMGRTTARVAVQLTRRVNRPDGSFGGVAVVAVDTNYFGSFYRQVDLGRTASVYLVGSDGIVRARRTEAGTFSGQDITGSPVLEMIKHSDTGQYRETSMMDGISRLHSYRSLREYPLTVVVGLGEAEVLEKFRERMARYFWVAGLVCLGIIVSAILLLRLIARQKGYEEDLRSARELLEAKVELRTHELSAVNEELTVMNEQYLALNEELQAMNRELSVEVAERRRTEEELRKSTAELAATYSELQTVQMQAYQQDKMASIGQLAAGVAHEINNPMAFVISNLESLKEYLGRLTHFISVQEEAVSGFVPKGREEAALINKVEDARQALKIDYVLQDVNNLIGETLEGADRVKEIVQDLKGFARVESESRPANINDGLESAINIVWNEMKYKAELTKELGELPPTRCNIGQMNQVFMNILMNAVQAIDKWGKIAVKTWAEGGYIFVSIADTGCGIPPQVLNNIFEPFFTTKEVGKGTGLGLSVAYDIVKRHGGEISVTSAPGKGATFTIIIPVVAG
jgi:signal transduction histidine kinase